MKYQNKWLWGAAALSLLLTTVVIEVPFLANAFQLVNLDLAEYMVAMALAVSVIPIVELTKPCYRTYKTRKADYKVTKNRRFDRNDGFFV